MIISKQWWVKTIILEVHEIMHGIWESWLGASALSVAKKPQQGSEIKEKKLK